MKIIFKKLYRLIESTKSQKKYLMASYLDLYFKMEEEREKIRKDIDKRASRIRMDPEFKREYRKKIDLLRNLEKNNRKILLDLMQQTNMEKETLRKDKVISKKYFGKSQLNEKNLSFNKIM